MITKRALLLMTALIAPAGAVFAHAEPNRSGAVYVLGNEPSGNLIHVYQRAATGGLTPTGTVPTGGTGAGTGIDPLASQGSLVYRNGYLFAVNAGSNDVTMFAANGTHLRELQRVASGGTMPVSVTVHGSLVYVLNAGGTPNISGFRLSLRGDRLEPLPGSTQALPGGAAAAPSEVLFSPDGEQIYVSEKGVQALVTYRVALFGYARHPVSTASQGNTPFGFDVSRDDVIVSEAASSSVSAYESMDSGALTPIGPALALGQTATCWLIVTHDGRHAYASNTGSSTISSLALDRDGAVSLLSVAAGSPANPLDLAVTRDDQYLYSRGGDGLVTGFQIHRDGSLIQVTVAGGIPTSAQGIAVD